MTLGDDTHEDGTQEGDGAEPGSEPNRNPGGMGQALRTIYQQTVEEAVPDEMLDLLGKLD